MELENNINNENNLEISIENERKQKNFFQTSLGKVVNNSIDFGLRTILPDMIENQIIKIKDALIENGIKDGLKTAVDSIIDFGKSVSGIFTGKFENIEQVETAIGKGGIIDTTSDLLDKALIKGYEKGVYNQQIKNLIMKGKDLILNSLENNLKKEIDIQEKCLNDVDEYINSFNSYYLNKDFEGMTREYNKIQSELENIFPLENVLQKISKTEIIYNLIKNNGNNFNLNESEIELIKKLKV